MDQAELRRPDPAKHPRRSCLSIVLALFLFGGASAVLFFLTLGSFGLVIAIGGGIFLLIGFHYVVWGWWLGKVIHSEERENERDDGTSGR